MSRHHRHHSRVPGTAVALVGLALLTASGAGLAATSNESAQEQPQTTLSLLPIVAPKTSERPSSPTRPKVEANAETKPTSQVEADTDTKQTPEVEATPDPAPVSSGDTSKPTPEVEDDNPEPVTPEVLPVPTDALTSGGLLSETVQACTFAVRLLGDPGAVCTALTPLTLN